ncbi:MAG: ABC transporter permease [Bacteroidetes bacterium]|jgi:ABC-2 type transport system permease protein|nr:ABC transporter permease [Bacteroidota bacterium]MBT6685729.1 ABC transporter permease [Bacteroidota bacterium]MBT7143025.1 ABC transporter permease [Bacteroidota bacterium]MBT7493438.1 ABC transporter permease [Bacteroidota bacterium]
MIKIYKKDIKLFFSDKKAVLLTFLLPIVLITLFALAYGGMENSDRESKPILLPVCNLEDSDIAKTIIADLDSVKGLKMEIMKLEDARQKVIRGKRAAILIFHQGFEDSLNLGKTLPIELQYDQAREMEIGILQSVLISKLMGNIGKSGIQKKVNNYILDKYPDIQPEVLNTIMDDLENDFSGNENSKNENNFQTGMALKTTSLVGEKQESALGLIQAVAGTAIMMLLFSVAGLGAGLIEEKEAGTLKKLLYSPVNPSYILYGKMMTGLTVSILQLLIMFLFAFFAFGLNISIDIPSLILMILATAFACSSFGIFLASVSNSRQQVQSLSTIIILIMSAIGGSMMPLFIMPEIIKIAVVSVNYWGIQGFYDIFWRQLPFTTVLIKAGILFGIGLLMTIISVQLFRKNVLKLV